MSQLTTTDIELLQSLSQAMTSFLSVFKAFIEAKEAWKMEHGGHGISLASELLASDRARSLRRYDEENNDLVRLFNTNQISREEFSSRSEEIRGRKKTEDSEWSEKLYELRRSYAELRHLYKEVMQSYEVHESALNQYFERLGAADALHGVIKVILDRINDRFLAASLEREEKGNLESFFRI